MAPLLGVIFFIGAVFYLLRSDYKRKVDMRSVKNDLKETKSELAKAKKELGEIRKTINPQKYGKE